MNNHHGSSWTTHHLCRGLHQIDTIFLVAIRQLELVLKHSLLHPTLIFQQIYLVWNSKKSWPLNQFSVEPDRFSGLSSISLLPLCTMGTNQISVRFSIFLVELVSSLQSNFKNINWPIHLFTTKPKLMSPWSMICARADCSARRRAVHTWRLEQAQCQLGPPSFKA